MFARAFTLLAFATATTAALGQTPRPTRDEITAFAKVHLLITRVRDSADVEVNKMQRTPEAMQQWRAALERRTEEILHHAGMTREQYRAKINTFSVDDDARKTFESVMAELTGVPQRGLAPPAAAGGGGRGEPAATMVAVPDGPAGTHIGHVVNSFADTPGSRGLLPTALGEARVAAQHAALAARTPTNLDAIKTHTAHVLNAVDPTIVAVGPGLGYGVKRAAQGIVSHIELAAKAQGSTPGIVLHATHIATSARNTVERVAQIVALGMQIQSATSAADAAALVTRLTALCDQLTAGVDANGDGRVTWSQGEGGLQQAQEHVSLMLLAEQR